MRAKLGLVEKLDEDKALIEDLYALMQAQPVDYTSFFRRLSHYRGERGEMLSLLQRRKPLEAWFDRYERRLEKEPISHHERHSTMQKTNPKYVLKNYILQEAIDAVEEGDYGLVNELLKIAQDPFAEHPAFETYAGPTPLKYKPGLCIRDYRTLRKPLCCGHLRRNHRCTYRCTSSFPQIPTAQAFGRFQAILMHNPG